MSDVQELERSILDARNRGDVTRMQKLQERYRAEASHLRVAGPGSIRIVERSSRSSTTVEPQLEDRSSSVPAVVVLRAEAFSTIQNWPHWENRECAGIMVGYDSDDGQQIIVESIFGADGANCLGERDRVVISRSWFDELEARAQSYGQKIVGDVHTHTHAAAKLSPTDEKGLRGAADHLRRHYIGIVAGRDPDRLGWGAHDNLWLRPELNAFVAVPGDSRVRPVELLVEGVG